MPKLCCDRSKNEPFPRIPTPAYKVAFGISHVGLRPEKKRKIISNITNISVSALLLIKHYQYSNNSLGIGFFDQKLIRIRVPFSFPLRTTGDICTGPHYDRDY